ncbi:MAG: helix-turn-helix domain-containing protein [Candidatus Pedobacter colombiensis]|uniref:Helix-turn-helix domain-containing protein n=1 Tax=Candidatus Pedobacter colombiensis TaxID=3121371 RepID=A0AAJ5WDR1_9SPHI|nr:helix-turn-helix domain-containing protein [Pedobacter sp.]WEK21640.1 MAG: helix-turn-helix domain-containing protein [Pedobacter sp.]
MLLQIISLLKEILAVLIDIRTKLPMVYARPVPLEEELLDNSDAKRLFKVCDQTLYRWRKKKLISTRMIGNKHYYLKADLIKMTENIGQTQTF